MGFEANTGLDVRNHYGQRTTGGTRGEVKTEGFARQFSVNLDASGFADMPIFQGNTAIVVTGIDTAFVSGTVTAVEIGGIDVTEATPSAPVEITEDSDGTVAVTGGTGGTLIVYYLQVVGDVFAGA